jgi:hypothetical protein
LFVPAVPLPSGVKNCGRLSKKLFKLSSSTSSSFAQGQAFLPGNIHRITAAALHIALVF